MFRLQKFVAGRRGGRYARMSLPNITEERCTQILTLSATSKCLPFKSRHFTKTLLKHDKNLQDTAIYNFTTRKKKSP